MGRRLQLIMGILKAFLPLIALMGLAIDASAYGDGDDPDCPWGCLMKESAQITEVRAYQHGAEFPVAIATGMAECPDGGYVTAEAENRSEMISLMLSAFHANTNVKLQVYKSKEWSSTTGPTHCMIRAVRLYK